MTKEYKINFDFTTVKGSRFSGRSGECCVNTENTLTDKDFTNEELKQVCAYSVYQLKPTWNIFLLTIKSITALNQQP